jgi:hypothetical protein
MASDFYRCMNDKNESSLQCLKGFWQYAIHPIGNRAIGGSWGLPLYIRRIGHRLMIY